jgi:probable poly-beta-1,6-N-acetyl-D-glucosamine export protein
MQNGTVMFVFIAGFLFQHTSSHFSYQRYLLTKLKNVIVPYIIISIPDLIYHYFRHSGIFASDYPLRLANPVLNVARAYLTSAEMPAPLWFVPMIALFYLMAPMLLAVDRRPKIYWVIAPLVILAMFMHRPAQLTSILQAAAYCLPAYVSGMWFSHYRESILLHLRKARWVLVGFCSALILVEVLIYQHGGAIMSSAPFSTESGLVDIDLPLKLVLSFVLTEVLQKYESHINGKLDYIAGASFGIFFLHEFVIRLILLISKKLQHPRIYGGILQFMVLLSVVLAVSIVCVYAIRKMLGRYSRMVIGC